MNDYGQCTDNNDVTSRYGNEEQHNIFGAVSYIINCTQVLAKWVQVDTHHLKQTHSAET